MTGDEFRARYQLLKRVTEAGVGTFHAVGPGGAVVMVHVFTGPEQAERAAEATQRLLPVDRTRILETLDVEGSPVLVTKFLLDFVSLESWFDEKLAAAEAEGYVAGPASAGETAPEVEGAAADSAAPAEPASTVEPPPVLGPAPILEPNPVLEPAPPVDPVAPTDTADEAGAADAVLPTISQEAAARQRPEPNAPTAPPEAAGDQGPAPALATEEPAHESDGAASAADALPPSEAPATEGGLTDAFAAFQGAGEPSGTVEPADVTASSEVHGPPDFTVGEPPGPVDEARSGPSEQAETPVEAGPAEPTEPVGGRAEADQAEAPTEAPAVGETPPAPTERAPAERESVSGVPGGLTAAFEAVAETEVPSEPLAVTGDEAGDRVAPPPPPVVKEPSDPAPSPAATGEAGAAAPPPTEASDTGSFTEIFGAVEKPEVESGPPPPRPSEPTAAPPAAAGPIESSVPEPPPGAPGSTAAAPPSEVPSPPEPGVPESPAEPEKGEFTQLFEAFGGQPESESPREPPAPPGAAAAPAEPTPTVPQPEPSGLPTAPEPVLGTFRIDDESNAQPPAATEEPPVRQAAERSESSRGKPPTPPEPASPAAPESPAAPPPAGTPEPPLPGPRIGLPWEEDLPLDEGAAASAASDPAIDVSPPAAHRPPAPPPPKAEPPAPPPAPPPSTGPGPLTRQFEVGGRAAARGGAVPPPPDRGLFGGAAERDSPLGTGSGLPDVSSDYLERLRSTDEPGAAGRAGGHAPPPPPPLATGGSAAAGAPPSSGRRSGPSEYSQIIKAIPLQDAPPESPSGPPSDAQSGALAQGPSRRLVIGVVVAAVVISLMTVVALVVWRFAGPSLRRLMDEPPAPDSAAAADEETGS
jgi:hypothetical protein